MKASEANMFRPVADIVWRGEPLGDRHSQVASQGAAMRVQGRLVMVDVEVTRFHALTEKTRYTIGGMHSLRFIMTVHDAATGAVIDGPRTVVADIKASGGAKALAEDQPGAPSALSSSSTLPKYCGVNFLARSWPLPVNARSADQVTVRSQCRQSWSNSPRLFPAGKERSMGRA